MGSSLGGRGAFLQAQVEVAERGEGAVHADFHGADAAIMEAGEFFVREMLQPMQREELPLLPGQGGEGAAEQGVFVGAGGLFGGVGRGIRQGVKLGGRGDVGGVVAPEVVSGDGAGEVVHPRGELALFAVRVPVFQDAEKNLLHEILARRALVGEVHEKTVERTVVALKERAEPGGVARAYGEHVGVIDEVGGVHGGVVAPSLTGGGRRGNSDFCGHGDHEGKRDGWRGEPRGGKKVTGNLATGRRVWLSHVTPVSPMNRRTFLTHSLTLAAAGLCWSSPLTAQSARSEGASGKAPGLPPATEFRSLRRGVGCFTGRGGTIGWLATAEALAVVDTQFADTAALCLAGLPGRADRKVDVVINTHHHRDHTGGNGIFRPAAQMLVAQRQVPKLQLRVAEKAGDTYKQVFADTLFDEVWRRELGDEVVVAQAVGPAHTAGDAVVLFEKANVVHLGDLVFQRLCPVIDREGGANIRSWIGALETLAKEYPEDTRYIFGHGNPKFDLVGSRADLLAMRDYLTALLSQVEKAIAAGSSRETIVQQTDLPGFPDYFPATGRSNRLAANLAAAYDELTGRPLPRFMPVL